jgi:ABC-type transport system involved in multi-copper enzyme maturation permease subunit
MLLETGALSLWISMHADRGREAMQVVYVIGVVLGLLPPLFALSPIPWPGGVVGWVLRMVDQCLTALNPVVWLVQAWQTGSPDWQNWILLVTINAALTCLLLLYAVRHVQHARLSQVEAGSQRFARRWLRLLRPGVWQQGILWKELFTEQSQKGLGSATRMLATLIGWGALLWMIWALVDSLNGAPASTRTPFQVFAVLVQPPLLCIGLLGVVVWASTCVTGERERRQWDSLLVTPVGAGELIWGKLGGCLWSMRWLWLLVGLLWVLGLVSGQLRLVALFETLFLVSALTLCAATLGLLLSLRCKTSLRALILAVGISLLLSGGYLLFALPLFMPLGPGREPPFGLLAPCVPFLFVTSIVLGVQDLPNAPQMLATCTTGGTIYVVAWLILLGMVWRSFDSLAGRTRAILSTGQQTKRLPASNKSTSSLARSGGE